MSVGELTASKRPSASSTLPCKGALGFFAVPPETCKQVAEAVRALSLLPHVSRSDG